MEKRVRRLRTDYLGIGALAVLMGTITVVSPIFGWSVIGIAVILLLTTRLRWQKVLLVFVGVSLLVTALTFLRAGSGPWERVVVDPLQSVRTVAVEGIETVLPGDAGALAIGLTVGDASYFSWDFRSAMKLSGTTHLIALSGYNVSLVLGGVIWLLGKYIGRRKAIYVGLGVLVLFVSLTGFQPSLVRASISAILLLGALLVGRRAGPLRIFVITAAIMVLLVPQWLTDLGFILSFISSWALLAMVGDMEQTALVMPQRLKGFWHTFVVPTMTAQIGVMPVLFAGIGVVYLIGFFANVLVLPLVPILMVLSGGLLVLTYVSVEVAGVLSFIVEFAAYPVIAIITLVSKVPLGITWTFAPLLALIGYSLFITYSLYREPRLW